MKKKEKKTFRVGKDKLSKKEKREIGLKINDLQQ